MATPRTNRMCARGIQAFAGVALAAGFALALPQAFEDVILRTPI